ncbi:MAG: DUF2092 domain-containing protein [Thermodesulfobacteriota bacterium]
MNKILKNCPKTLMLVLFVFFIFGLTYLQSLSETGYSEKAFAADPDTKIDPRTFSILKEMTQFISIKNNYTFKAEIMFDVISDSGQKLQVTGSEKVFLQKPDKVFIEYKGDYSAYKFLYNYNSVTLLDSTSNLYTQINAPETINSTFDKLIKVYRFAPPLSDFFYLFPYKSLIENVVSSTYVGSSIVFGIRCHHLSFQEKDKDWQIWIEDGKRKIPRKVVINYKNNPGSPQFTAIILDWILNESFSETLFNQNLTKNAAKSETNLVYKEPGSNLGIIRNP